MRIAVVEHQTVRPFELVRQAVVAGHQVVFVTCDLGLYLKGRPVSDTDLRLAEQVLTPAATTDADQLLAALAPLADGPGLDAVLTMSEQHTLAVARTAARLGLPHTAIEAVQLTRDKFRARERLAAAGIPQPRFRLTGSSSEAVAAAAEIGFPVVVKPVDGSASVNVAVAHDSAAVRACAEHVLALRHYGRSATAARRILVEQYMDGPVVSCETLTAQGRHLILGLTDRQLTPLPHQVELGGCFPADLDGAEEISAMCRSALDAIGFDFGAAHTEMVLTADGPRIVEVNGRLAGGPMPFVFGAALDRPIYLDIAEIFGGGGLPSLRPTGLVAGIRSLVAPRSGRLAAVEPSPHRNAEGVVDYEIRRAVGDLVHEPHNNRDRCGSVVTVAPTAEAARSLAAKVVDTTVLAVDRERVVLLDRAGYRRYHTRDGRPMLDPSRYDVTLVTRQDLLDQADPGEVTLALATDVEQPDQLAEAIASATAGRGVDRVLAVSERLLLPAAALRDRLGLPGPSEKQMQLLRDKVAMKDHLSAAGIAVPEYAEVTGPSQIREMLKRHAAVVVKPTLAMGAKDVRVVRDEAGLAEFADPAGQPFGDGQPYLVEQFVDGDLFHVDSIVQDGTVLVAIASRYLTKPIAFTRRETVCAVQLGDEPTRDVLLEFNARVMAQLDWFSGVTHHEIFRTAEGRPLLCEIAGRPGGGGIIPGFEHLYDVDLYQAALRPQLGELLTAPAARVHPSAHPDCGLTAWAVLYAEPGRLVRVDVPRRPWIIRANVRRAVGELVSDPIMAGDGTVTLAVCGPDPETVTARLRAAIADTHIVTEPLTERSESR